MHTYNRVDMLEKAIESVFAQGFEDIGIPEIIEDGKTGFLFEVNNQNELLEKFDFIYNNFDKLKY